ncbi:MAG: VOC family protein [Pseudomonadota bacterium]
MTARTLEEGVAFVEERLGVQLEPGGRHEAMGTRNRLLSLGEELYLEVIAVDPEAASPSHKRWFNLDRFSGPPRLSNWVARCEHLDEALRRAPAGSGEPMSLERGELRWEMAVPDDGLLPFDGCFPALIAWAGNAHPARNLPDRGCRLHSLELRHPRAEELRLALRDLIDDRRIEVTSGSAPGLRARIVTPTGECVLD